jgi:hypothetical protein
MCGFALVCGRVGVFDFTMSNNGPLSVHHACVQPALTQCNNAHFATVLHRKRSYDKCFPDHVLCSCGFCAAHSELRSDKRSALLAQRTASNRHLKR